METRILTRDEMIKALDVLEEQLGRKAKECCIEIIYRENGKSVRLFCDDFKTNGNEDTTTSKVV
jgi:hypothetical protein